MGTILIDSAFAGDTRFIGVVAADRWSRPRERRRLALQWEFTFPPNVSVDMADIAAGSAAESGQKSLTCRAVVDRGKKQGKASCTACILAGGQKPIPNGPIALVRYRVPKEIRQIAERSEWERSSGRQRT